LTTQARLLWEKPRSSWMVGSATFTTEPSEETIVLHVNDEDTCKALYPGSTALTCFVLPGPKPGPVCNAADAGDSNAAYNNIPKDAVDCGPPSLGFEATSTKEFGDEVVLEGSGRIDELTVLFNSYACEDSPQWNNEFCTTTVDGHFFTHEITAHIYASNDLIIPIASATQPFQIPYRPSADVNLCKDGNGDPTGAFFNSVSGTCDFSKKTLLTFTDWDVDPVLSGNVVWTVEFNTGHYGDTPLAPQACNSTLAGCPYDSLNVGAKTFDGAPYAGDFANASDAVLDSTWAGAYCDNGSAGTGTLRPDSGCWTPYQPLGMIVLLDT